MKIEVLCTLGPASLRGDVIGQLDARGVSLFRINLSHTPLEAIEDVVTLVRRYSSVPISLDTEGAQVRCGEMAPDVVLEPGAEVELTAEPILGSAVALTLWPRAVFEVLTVGSVVRIDFDGAVLRIIDVGDGRARALVTDGGQVRSNKGSTVEPQVSLPALSDKDRAAVAIGAELGLKHYALSFASCAEDVAELRALLPEDARVITKIESRTGIANMDGIVPAADAVLIDRGDLSRDVPIERIPYYQKAIVRRANRWHRPVYVATNLLESMVTQKLPTVAEANDIANSLLDGVHGLVLAAETAIGVDPVGAVDVVRRAVSALEEANGSHVLEQPGPHLRAVA
jgi:pyruvate kinase